MLKVVQAHKLHLLPPGSKDLSKRWRELSDVVNKNDLFRNYHLNAKSYKEAFEKFFDANCQKIESPIDFYLETEDNPWTPVMEITREMKQERETKLTHLSDLKDNTKKRQIEMANLADEVISHSLLKSASKSSRSRAIGNHSAHSSDMSSIDIEDELHPTSVSDSLSSIDLPDDSSSPLHPSESTSSSSSSSPPIQNQSKKPRTGRSHYDEDDSLRSFVELQKKKFESDAELKREELRIRQQEVNLLKDVLLSFINKETKKGGEEQNNREPEENKR